MLIIRKILTEFIRYMSRTYFFFSYSYVMLGDTSYASELRNLIAKSVSGDPQTYNPVFLGGNNSDYCNWILDKEHWGGMSYAPCPLLLLLFLLLYLP